MHDDSTVAILGAGITGLSIAFSLKKKGHDVAVYEKEKRVGGVIQTRQSQGWMVEEGPNTMLVRDQKIWDLLNDLQLTNRILKSAPQAKKRYVVRNGAPVPLPTSFTGFLTTNLLSASAKLRLLKEPFIAAPRVDDESIARFIRRRLGPEPLNYGVNPFVSGIYAGDPEQLSVKHTFDSLLEMEQNHGSLTRGFLKRDKKKNDVKRALISFDKGLNLLPKTMAESLPSALHLNTKVLQISHQQNSWQLRLQSGNKKINHRHPMVISTLPTHQLPAIWSNEKSQQDIYKLSNIEYAPMSVLALGFKRDQIEHPLDGFGMLIPEKEPFSMLGCLFSSSLFPKRAPKNQVLLSCFIGGARHPELAAKSTESLVSEIMPQLNTLLGLKGKPVFRHHTFWPQAIPQYTVGYDDYLESMHQIESTHPGFFLAGNYRGGVSVPDCIMNGFEMAERVKKSL